MGDRTRPGSVLGLAPSAAAAEVLAGELGIDTENTAKWLFEHRREAERVGKIRELRTALGFLPNVSDARAPLRQRIRPPRTSRPGGDSEQTTWSSSTRHPSPEPSLSTSSWAPPPVLGQRSPWSGDQGQLSAVEAGGAFAALARDPEASLPN